MTFLSGDTIQCYNRESKRVVTSELLQGEDRALISDDTYSKHFKQHFKQHYIYYIYYMPNLSPVQILKLVIL